jgi:hypothetical protein
MILEAPLLSPVPTITTTTTTTPPPPPPHRSPQSARHGREPVAYPALATTTSIMLWFRRRATNASVLTKSEWSTTSQRTLLSEPSFCSVAWHLSALRVVTITSLAPWRARTRAVSRPNPDPPPVTRYLRGPVCVYVCVCVCVCVCVFNLRV